MPKKIKLDLSLFITRHSIGSMSKMHQFLMHYKFIHEKEVTQIEIQR